MAWEVKSKIDSQDPVALAETNPRLARRVFPCAKIFYN